MFIAKEHASDSEVVCEDELSKCIETTHAVSKFFLQFILFINVQYNVISLQ
jgi:hypothetical protein